VTRTLPRCTIGVATLALLAWASPAVSALLVYDRALVDQGEVWRIVGSAFVHWSPRHLALDLGVVIAAGAALERLIGVRLVIVVLLSALVSGLAVHLAPPWLDHYAGLSGVAYTLVALVAIAGTAGAAWQRVACLTTLATLVAKLAIESLAGSPLLAGDMPGVVVATGSHAAGLAVAFALALRPANLLSEVHASLQ
jgi:rhomboid family GlyGly-CTERM serine protease